AASALGTASRRAPGPGARVRLQGLERRGRRGLLGPHLPRCLARRGALRDDRSRGVLRLPGHPPVRLAHRWRDARDHLAGGRDLRGPRAARAARPRARRGRRALHAVAHLLRDGHRPRRGARRADGRHPRRPARRRPAHPARRRERPRLRRRADGAPRRPEPGLRGADRHRRRPALGVLGGRDPLRVAVGGGAALRRGGPQPEGRARHPAQARGPGRRDRRRLRARDRRARVRPPGHARGRDGPGRAGVRRAPGARGVGIRDGGEPDGPAVRGRHRPRVPALPAPARAGV
ncbi:MAG: PFIG00823557: AC2 (Proteasome assembly chaperone) family, partial [uncultured Solirubrobacteraceae bacterium]